MNWIWIEESDKNTFAEFKTYFNYEKGKSELRISSDYKYVAYINGRMVSNGQYADLPNYKCINSLDISSKLKKGENELFIIAWHMGEDCSVCRTMPAAVAFEVIVDGKIIAQSDKNTLARKSVNYLKSGLITGQLGYGFNYDFTSETNKWENAIEVKTGFVERDRPIKATNVGDFCFSKIIAQGVFDYREEFTDRAIAYQMQKAWLSSLRFKEMAGKGKIGNDIISQELCLKADGGRGLYFIFDMGKETCGHLGFSITVNSPCKMMVGWGEHLADMRVRTEVDGRAFVMSFNLKAGLNVFDDYLLRLGCRYLCFFVETNQVVLNRVGMREVVYPFSIIEKDFGDKLYNAIYAVGRRTLCLCAREHYEDGPWREQGLYGMDSRNQMLFGYGAFEEYEYARANLMLFAKGMREDGLVSITPPAESANLTIPSYTAYWLMAIGENVERDYNESFVNEILPYAEKAINKLLQQESDCGMLLFEDLPYWNFHEWSDGLSGCPIKRSRILDKKYDAALTALSVIALRKMAYVYDKAGKCSRSKELLNISARIGARLDNFYDKTNGLYASYIKDGVKSGYHVFVQSLVLLTGCVPQNRIERICEVLKSPSEYGVVPATLGALQFKYDALIKYGNHKDFCLDEIVKIFGKMIFSGATSFWETEYGEADFDDAGGLCHGWSAVACWVLDECLGNK